MLFGGSFIFLFLENYGVRKLEAVFALLIATMAISFAWMFRETQPSQKELLIGKLFTSLFYLKVTEFCANVYVTLGERSF